MRDKQVVNNLSVFTPALAEISELNYEARMPHAGGGVDDFKEDIERLSVLPEFERSSWGGVIPVNRGLNVSPRGAANLGTDSQGRAKNIMNVHAQIRFGISEGVRAMEHLADYGSELDLMKTIIAARSVKKFAGFAIVRATQVDSGGWRRGNGHDDYDGEGLYIARHQASYRTLKPLMTRQFRRLTERAIAEHGG